MTRLEGIVRWVLGPGRWPLLAAVLLVTLGLAGPLAGLRVEGDTSSMTAVNPDQQAAQERLRRMFGNDEALLVSLTSPQLLSVEGMALVRELTQRIAALPGVAQVLSLTTASQLVSGRYGAEPRPLVANGPFDQAAQRKFLRAVKANPQYQGLLISGDLQTAGLVIQPVAAAGRDNPVPALIQRLRGLLRDYHGRGDLHLTGVGVQKHDVAEYIRRDQRTVLPLVVTVLALLLGWLFRRPGGVLFPLLVTGGSLLWTMGLFAWCGLEMNTISALLPPVVMILSVSHSVHLYHGWLQLAAAGNSPEQARELWPGRVAELVVPCSFTALTTGLGLLSLWVSPIPAVRQFGLFGALGVAVSLLLSLLLVPIGLSFCAVPKVRLGSAQGLLGRLLARIAATSLQRPRTIISVALLLLLLAAAALPRLQNNTSLVGFFRATAPLARDTAFIDEHLGGVNALEFMLSRTDQGALDQLGDYQRLEHFEKRALQHPEIAKAFSILPLLRQVQRAETGSTELQLPTTADDLHYDLELLATADGRDQAGQFLTLDRKTARMTLLFHDVGSHAALRVVRDLERSAREIFGSAYRLVPTGSYYQVILDSAQLVNTMLKSFGLSLLTVMLAILVLLRSVRLTLLAMIPNLIPIVWTLGVMGALGIDLSSGTVMIGAVAFGLAVDDTIHYLVCYRRLQGLGASNAVQATTTGIGRALLITTLVLVLGFWTGCLGSFKPTIYFSFLVGGTLLGALVCDLLVLPASLVLWARPLREGAP